MKKKQNFNLQKDWETVEVATGGYVETGYEFFEYIDDIPLLKSTTADVWYIGELRKGEKPNEKQLFYDEATARKEFETVKAFQQSEMGSRHRFNTMSSKELIQWIERYGENPYMGRSVYLFTAEQNLKYKQQAERKKGLEM